MTPESFIARWQKSGAAERANYGLFLTELCTLLDVPQPEPTQDDDAQNAYVFERAVKFAEADGTSSGRIDLYRRGSFVLEAKQGSDADDAMLRSCVPKRKARSRVPSPKRARYQQAP